MPTRHQLVLVARELKQELNGKAFFTIPRMDVTEILRKKSGEDTTRIKSNIAADLEKALLEQGIRCYPPLATTTTGDTVRLFHAGSILGDVVDLLIHPSSETDRELGNLITKIKGKWDWAGRDSPETEADGLDGIAPTSPATDGSYGVRLS